MSGNKYYMANRMESYTHIFQISGIKNCDKKRVLIQGIQHLSGKYLGGSIYQQAITHLIIPQVISSEKFFAACAAGKWVVTPDYVLDSVRNGCWLTEDQYEVSIGTDAPSAFYPVRQWREKVASGRLTGAFEGWRVLLLVQEPSRRAMFERLLVAGKAEVYDAPPPSHSSITHVMAKPITENSQSYGALCYFVTHIVQHLFGNVLVQSYKWCDSPIEYTLEKLKAKGRNCMDMNFMDMDVTDMNVTDSHPTETNKNSVADVDLSELEAELRDYVIHQQSRPRLRFPEFLGYHDPYCSQSQATETDFSNVGSMIECSLFAEALDSIRSAVLPGLLPPVAYLISLLEYALQENTTAYFQKNFLQLMNNLPLNHPPLLGNKGKKYFKQVLQCPQCKMGVWPFLQSAISVCLSSEATCHPLPAPASPALIRFYCDLVTFVLRLFQAELHSVTAGDFGQPQGTGVSKASASGTLLNATFWTVWEHSTLLSQSVKQLCQLLLQAAAEEFAEKEERQSLYLADTLLNLLSVVVEFWCHKQNKLNWKLADKGLKDLAEHLAVISRDVAPAVVVELVVRVSSTRLKMTMADAVFRSLCCRSGFTLEDNPLSLKKMVLSYLPSLGRLAHSPSDVHPRTGATSTTHSGIRQETDCRTRRSSVKNTGLEKENVPRGLSKVNTAGETLLHRACKRNQVETVLQILALPGTDINVKDHAGWTPLHEACNHGSTACVEALLPHIPPSMVQQQVGGVTPLHDALLNGHMDIAKLLLRHAGSVLLQQTDGCGRTPLDLLSDASQREELLLSAQVRDSSPNSTATEAVNRPLLEAGSTLLAHLIFSYQQEMGLSALHKTRDKTRSLGQNLVRALKTHTFQEVTSGWTEQRAIRLAEDVETLLMLGSGAHQSHVSRVVGECEGESTHFLQEILELLRSKAETMDL